MMAEETKEELIAAAKSQPPMKDFSLRPRTFEEAFRFANLIAESDLVPKEFQRKPANVMVAVQLGMELGVSPMQALQNIAVINGRPALWGDLLPAIVLNSGLMEQFDEQGDEKEASCTVKRKGFAAITRKFSMEDANRAGLPARNPTYKSYPKRMLQMRARAFAFRDMFADVLKGVAIKEEVEDMEPRDITPANTEPPKELPVIAHKINERQRKRFYVACTAKGLSDEDVGRILALYGYSSNHEIMSDKFDELMAVVESKAIKPTEPPKSDNPQDESNAPTFTLTAEEMAK
jgi:hypothetical protein